MKVTKVGRENMTLQRGVPGARGDARALGGLQVIERFFELGQSILNPLRGLSHQAAFIWMSVKRLGCPRRQTPRC